MQQVTSVVLSIMEGLRCPRALSVAILARYGEWQQVAQLSVVPSDYLHHEDYWRAAQATALLKKCEDLPLNLDRRKAALVKWEEAEVQCFWTNRRLAPFVGKAPFEVMPSEALFSIISKIRGKIRDCIGPKPPTSVEPRFGPGATQSDEFRHCTVPDKLTSTLTLTPAAWPWIVPWLGTAWGRAHTRLEKSGSTVLGNKYFTVPKTVLTDRSCGKEPSLNVAYQLAYGSVLRARLKRVGIDLDRGQMLHRRLAQESSISSKYATIDLSSASDTVCINLVKLLLPPAWFSVLDALRSHFTEVDGKQRLLEKFSSMGNGFTFELETLIFWAISSAVQRDQDIGDVYVYGDDIIVPSESVEDVRAALTYFGFSLNREKTFLSGHFRESCGGDYFDGVPVRPYHLRSIPNDPATWIQFANGLRRVCRDDNTPSSRWTALLRSWHRILDNVPQFARICRGPVQLGDIVIHDDEERWTTRERGNGIRYVRTFRPRVLAKSHVLFERFAYDVQYAAALYLAGRGYERRARTASGDFVPRDPILEYKVGWTPYS